MEKLEVDGIIYSEDSIIRDKAVQFYETLYMETKDCRPFVDDLSFSRDRKSVV